MTHLLVKHRVTDYATGRGVFDDFADVRRSGGEKSFRILHPSGDPNSLTLQFGPDSVENAKEFMKSPGMKAAMEQGGMTEEPTITFLEESARGKL